MPIFSKKIENAVNVGKGQLVTFPEGRLFHDAHIVVEDAVKTDVTEAEFPRTSRKLYPIILAEGRRRVAASDAHLPISLDRICLGIDV